MKKLIIPPVFLITSLLLILVCYFTFPECNIIPYPLNLIGIVIAFLGFIIIGKSHELFRKYNTTLDFKKSSHMITDGIFSKTRNPMYIGMFLFLLGISICFKNYFAGAIPFIFILITRILFIPREEKLMYNEFGEKYSSYKKRVKRWI